MLQTASIVTSTAALKDSMKEKQEPNEREAILKELAEAFGIASKELGYKDPTQQ